MALELNFFGAPIQVGTFDFFDLMDTFQAPQQFAAAEVYTFEAKPTAQAHTYTDTSLQSAA